jgi:phosphoribosyl-AMP cyclohydrolase / phosphoribosyl-ATP pyrophosphohydrolase
VSVAGSATWTPHAGGWTPVRRSIIVGTAASVEFCAVLPRDRLIAAVDAERGEVVVEGWRTPTARDPVDRIRELAPAAGGFLLTQVEVEGGMAGFDRDLVTRAVDAAQAGGARLTAAGGITTSEEVAWLDAQGADAQVGMALYTGRLPLEVALGAVLRRGIEDRLWPTVVADETGEVLGLVWSTRASLAAAVRERQGIYWSRSRNALWRKGGSSGAVQQLVRVEVDCDRDALRFTVRQAPPGFCHTGVRSCWGERFSLGTLERTIATRVADPAPGSGTAALFADPALLHAKLVEEAGELARAESEAAATHEAADLLYFTLVAMARRGVTLEAVRAELHRRHARVRRRPMTAKAGGGET